MNLSRGTYQYKRWNTEAPETTYGHQGGANVRFEYAHEKANELPQQQRPARVVRRRPPPPGNAEGYFEQVPQQRIPPQQPPVSHPRGGWEKQPDIDYDLV